jgi:hypothetical protein
MAASFSPEGRQRYGARAEYASAAAASKPASLEPISARLPAMAKTPPSSAAREKAASPAAVDEGTASFPTQMRGPPPESSSAAITTGGVSPVVPYAARAARFAAAVFCAAEGLAGTTILPFRMSAMPSPLVSSSSHPRAKASATRPVGAVWNANAATAAASSRSAPSHRLRSVPPVGTQGGTGFSL